MAALSSETKWRLTGDEGHGPGGTEGSWPAEDSGRHSHAGGPSGFSILEEPVVSEKGHP